MPEIPMSDAAAVRIMLSIVAARFPLQAVNCLTPFGRDGQGHTHLYADQVGHIAIWECDQKLANALKKNFPFAFVKCCDSYAEIKARRREFNLVVIDNNLGDIQHIEDFDLFPDIYGAIKGHAIICQCSCMLDPWEYWQMGERDWDDKRLIDAREDFFGTPSERIDRDTMTNVHRRIAAENGFSTGLECVFRRAHGLHYYIRELIHGDS